MDDVSSETFFVMKKKCTLKASFGLLKPYSHWGHLARTTPIPLGIKLKNSRAHVVSWDSPFCIGLV